MQSSLGIEGGPRGVDWQPVDIFAFPYGDFDDAVVDAAKVGTTPRDSLLDFWLKGARRV